MILDLSRNYKIGMEFSHTLPLALLVSLLQVDLAHLSKLRKLMLVQYC